ncbi:MAG: hypothetical protein FJ009_09995 [Chloroflexi bacterium]|nr:hypothetical protein [Chloroflexota bacterium]
MKRILFFALILLAGTVACASADTPDAQVALATATRPVVTVVVVATIPPSPTATATLAPTPSRTATATITRTATSKPLPTRTKTPEKTATPNPTDFLPAEIRSLKLADINTFITSESKIDWTVIDNKDRPFHIPIENGVPVKDAQGHGSRDVTFLKPGWLVSLSYDGQGNLIFSQLLDVSQPSRVRAWYAMPVTDKRAKDVRILTFGKDGKPGVWKQFTFN